MQRRSYRILIVEDNPSDRLILKTMLISADFDYVREAGAAPMAFSKIETAHSMGEPFHLIFVDWNLPGESGMHLIQRLRLDRRNSVSKTIVVTGNSDKVIVAQAIEAGAADFIVKPISEAVLLSKIERVLLKDTK